jgi:2-iminobutanoate/2-iminopropanoate deaminase
VANKEVVFTEEAPRAIGPYSQAVKAGGFVFVSGQIALDPGTGQLVLGDARIQTRRALETLRVARLPRDALVEIDAIALA